MNRRRSEPDKKVAAVIKLGVCLVFLLLSGCRSARMVEDFFMYEGQPQNYLLPYSAEDAWGAVCEEIDSIPERNILALESGARLISWVDKTDVDNDTQVYIDNVKSGKRKKFFARKLNVAWVEEAEPGVSTIYIRQVYHVFHKKKPVAVLGGSKGRYEKIFIEKIRRRLALKIPD